MWTMSSIELQTRTGVSKWRVSMALGALVFCSTVAAELQRGADQDIWLSVDTRWKTLQVMSGRDPVETFDHIAIGRRGASHDKERGDDKTPLGEYRIGWINERSSFHRFFGFTYPSLQIARRAFARGLISGDTLDEIMTAHLRQSVPPQSTPLGGRIGIHGLGNGDPRVHELFDWTHGCIALTNRQIDRLGQWVRKGTLVMIR